MNNDRKKILAGNLRAERHRKNISQFQLAEKIGVSESTISLIERGLQSPSVFLLLDIAEALNIDIKELLRDL